MMKLKSVLAAGLLAVSATAVAWQLQPYENMPQQKPYDWQGAQQHQELMWQMERDRAQRQSEETNRNFERMEQRFHKHEHHRHKFYDDLEW